MFRCTLVDPDYPAERRRRFGIAQDPLVGGTASTPLALVPLGAGLAGLLVGIALAVGVGGAAGAAAAVLLPLLALGVTAAVVGARIGSERRRALRTMEEPLDMVSILNAMQGDAVRFRNAAAAQPTTATAAADAAPALGRLLWRTADRIDEIGRLRSELIAADGRPGGAVAAYRADLETRIDRLRKPVEDAAARVRALADAAQDVVYAAKLTDDREASLALEGTSGADELAASSIDDATTALDGMRAAWAALDERLRLLGDDRPA